MENWNKNDMNPIDNNNNEDKENKKNKKKITFKKGAGIALCAVLAGGLVFEGINAIDGFNFQNIVKASGNNEEEDRTELLKTAKEKESKEKDKKSEDAEEETSEEKTKTDKKEEADASRVKGSLDVSDIAAEGMKSVVAITTKTVQEVQTYIGDFGFGGFTTTPQEVEGSGSGIIVGKNDEELLIATNYHVIEGANTVTVTCIDGEVYEAKVKGYDADKDLAVVSVEVADISDDTMDQIEVATIGSSDDLRVGEQVIAIGNALGYGQSVTTGIVSAKNRKLDDSGQADEDSDGVNLIQTDAAINPGNSGGALLNMNGEVVGINSAKLASTEIEGMGYSIAITDVSDILENLMNETPRDKTEDHGVLGITGNSVSEEASEIYGIPEGVHIVEITKDGAADKAGMKENNIITEFDGKRVRTIEALVDMLQYYEPGEEVEVTLQVLGNGGYEEKKVTVTLDKNENKEETEDSKEAVQDAQGEGQEESILEQFGEGTEDDATYEEFFGDIW
nr:trypsin-like peptidase domain-containing protein [uncultured Blautia sp.]